MRIFWVRHIGTELTPLMSLKRHQGDNHYFLSRSKDELSRHLAAAYLTCLEVICFHQLGPLVVAMCVCFFLSLFVPFSCNFFRGRDLVM